MWTQMITIGVVIISLLAFAQGNSSQETSALQPFSCFTDVCNLYGQAQFCSRKEEKCRDCLDVIDSCYEPDFPSNCTSTCIEYHVQKEITKAKETACSVLSTLQNGRFNDSQIQPHVPGDVIEMSCDPGFHLQGSRTLNCKEYGQWSHELPECKEIKCQELPPVENGFHNGSSTGSNLPGDVVSVTCDHGYRRIGPDSTTCASLGAWNTQFPVCQKIMCPFLNEVKNGKHNGSMRTAHVPGDNIVYVCDEYFILVGSNTTECNNQGTWTRPLPWCQEIKCTPPLNISNGKWSNATQTKGGGLPISSTIMAHCNDGYSLNGPTEWECSRTGTWWNPAGLDMPYCFKEEINAWMIMTLVEAGLLFLGIVFTLISITNRRWGTYKNYRPVKTDVEKGSIEMNESNKQTEEELNSNKDTFPAKQSPKEEISLSSQKNARQREDKGHKAIPNQDAVATEIDRHPTLSKPRELDANSQKDSSISIPTPRPVFDSSPNGLSDSQSRAGESEQERRREDNPNDRKNDRQTPSSESPNNPSNFTVNINNNNQIVYGNGADSRTPQQPDTNNTVPKQKQNAQTQMADLKPKNDKSPVQEQAIFQPSQPETSLDTENEERPRNDESGEGSGLITGLAVQQSGTNEQDLGRKMGMPNGNMNMSDINARHGQHRNEGGLNDGLGFRNTGELNTMNDVNGDETCRKSEMSGASATDDFNDTDDHSPNNVGLIEGLAIQQNADTEQAAGRKIAMRYGEMKADDINVGV